MPKRKPQPDFSALRWWRIRVEFRPLKPNLRSPHAGAVEAIVKGTTDSLGWLDPDGSEHEHPRIFHHLVRWEPRERPTLIEADVFLCRADRADAWRWAAACRAHMADPTHCITYALEDCAAPEERSLEKLMEENGDWLEDDELCLRFDTPFSFHRPKEKPRTFLSRKTFVQAFERRFSRLFGIDFTYRSSKDDFEVLPWFWHYSERRRSSKSQPGTVQYVKGCAGPLYLKGRFSDFLPWLILGSELHCGSKLANAQGHYRLQRNSPFFSRRFPQRAAIRKAVGEVIHRHDRALLQASVDGGTPFDADTLTERLHESLIDGSWQPSPNQAFAVPKSNGGERMVERLGPEDLVIHQLLRRLLAPVIEKMLEDEAIGYRPGRSRHEVETRVRKALDDGYRYVLESDIDDFFPSVDLTRLFTLLDDMFPVADHKVLDVLKTCLQNGYVFKNRLQDRDAGLAQGSPLSPLLANLYLDAFDEDLQRLDARMIRYADDFIVLTRTEEQAQAARETVERSLDAIRLKIKPAKTAIHRIDEGFRFLGLELGKGEPLPDFEQEGKRLKKPLYVTEPAVFLAKNGSAVDVTRYRKILETIPLGRISEIMVLEKSVISTALLAECVERKVPVSLSLGSGYNIVTVKPDSKEYYLTVGRHAERYNSMSDTERLAMAAEVAQAKLLNYLPVFKQRYTPGTASLLHELERAAKSILQAGSVNEIRGIEGQTTRRVFAKIGAQIKDDAFTFTGRRRKKPDPLNSLFNFGYYLLFMRLNALVRCAGLSPYLGFLHSPADDYESLVCDLQEPFRSRVDRLLLRLLNLKIITSKHFQTTDRGAYLTHEGRKLFLQHYEAELTRKRNPGELSWLELLQVQVAIVSRWVKGESSLSFYRWKS